MSRINSALMITDSKQAWLAKMTGRRVQEELLFFQNPDGPDANLMLTPTSPRPMLDRHSEDLRLK